MSDLLNEITMKHEMLSILNSAISEESIEKKINIIRLVFTDRGIEGIINTGIRKQVDGLNSEIEELKKIQKRIQ